MFACVSRASPGKSRIRVSASVPPEQDGDDGQGEAFVGIDAAKRRNAVAIAGEGRDAEVRYLGTFDATPASMRRLVARLAGKFGRLHFCYEAGPTGYESYRLIVSLGHACTVVAPLLIPRKPGGRIKTNQRGATTPRPLRAGALTAVRLPDPAHKAMRNRGPRSHLGG